MIRYAIKRTLDAFNESGFACPTKIIFANGETYETGGKPEITVHFKTRSAEWGTVIFSQVGFIEAYINGRIDLVGEDALRKVIQASYLTSGKRKAPFFSVNPLVRLRQVSLEAKNNNKSFLQAKLNAYAHYNLPAEFFRHMLGETYGYTEGYYAQDNESQSEAQNKKYEYICRKLRLRDGDRMVEVGTGWGTMAITAAEKFGASVVNYGLVPEQNRIVAERVTSKGLENKVTTVVRDHRSLKEEPNAYDKYVSLGVYEHAGKDCQREWIESIAVALKPGGVGVISTTGRMGHALMDYLIAKYIFPGAYLPSLSRMLELMEEYGLHVLDIENVKHHYARTMEDMLSGLNKNWTKIQAIDPTVFTEKFKRTWSMWFLGSIEAFRCESETLQAFHIVFMKGRSTISPRFSGPLSAT